MSPKGRGNAVCLSPAAGDKAVYLAVCLKLEGLCARSRYEAWWYCLMPFPEQFTAADFAAKTGFPEYECAEMCETFAMKGLLMRYDRGGVPWYFCCNMPFGHIEKFDDPEFLNGWNTMFSGPGYTDNFDAGTKLYTISPVNADVCANSEIVSPFDDWREIINRNEYFVIDPCCCKSMYAASQGDFRYLSDVDARLSDGHNDRINVCLAMGELVQYYIWKGVGRQVTRVEALDSVQQSMEEGLIIEHYYDANTEVLDRALATYGSGEVGTAALPERSDALVSQATAAAGAEAQKQPAATGALGAAAGATGAGAETCAETADAATGSDAE